MITMMSIMVVMMIMMMMIIDGDGNDHVDDDGDDDDDDKDDEDTDEDDDPHPHPHPHHHPGHRHPPAAHISHLNSSDKGHLGSMAVYSMPITPPRAHVLNTSIQGPAPSCEAYTI